MSYHNLLVVDGKPIEGVYNTVDWGTYKKHARTGYKPLTECATCGLQSIHCKEGGVALKVCKGCHVVAFCSKKCQIDLWPSHKKKCQPSELGDILGETVGRFLSHPFLLHHLRVALISKMAYSQRTLKFSPKECHLIVVYLNFHPVSREHEKGLVLGEIDSKGKDKIPGYLRLEIHDDPPVKISVGVSGKRGLTLQRENDTLLVRLWRQARRHADSIGHERYPIVMVGFGYGNTRQDYGIEITPEAIATALGTPNSSPATAIPPSIKPPPLPWTFDDVIFHIILKYISLDKEDTLNLRRDLRRVDKEHLRWIGLKYFTTDGPQQMIGAGWSPVTAGSELNSPRVMSVNSKSGSTLRT